MTDPARDLHDALAPRAFPHDPDAYLAGVDDALARQEELEREHTGEPSALDAPG